MNYSDKFGATSFQEVSSPFAKGGFDIAIPGSTSAPPTPSGIVKINDAELLFSGSYKREGSDLVISNDVRKLVVPDYFKGEVRPTLSSRDGATLSGGVIEALTGHVAYAQASGAPEPPKEIGTVGKLTGSATAIRNGVAVELNVGDKVYKGDVVQSGQGASLGITFVDGTVFSLSSNARMVLNEMVYDPNGSSNSSLLSLVQGTITFVAGQTAKNGNMRVDTPVATMGIRGTAVLVEIGANNGPTKFSVLVEPGNKVGSFNLYDKTTGALLGSVSQAGQVTLVTPAGIGQQANAVELPKTIIDLQNERSLIKQAFEMFFPNFNDANPQGTKGIGSSVNNLANFLNGLIKVDPGTVLFKQDVNLVGQSGPITITATAVTTPPPIVITDATDIQPPEERGGRFNIADQIEPNSRIIPYIAGTLKLDTAEGPGSMPEGFNLRGLVTFDPQTGEITYNPSDFRFLADGEKAVFTFSFQSQSDEFIFVKTLTLTVDGLNDAPIFTVENFAAPVVEPGSTDSTASFSKQGTLTFTDLDFSDVASGYTVQTLGVTATGKTTAVPSTATLLGFLRLDGVVKAVGSTQGVITETFTAPASAFDYLAAGETVNLAYQIRVTDADGASRTSTLTVTITGTNDAPTITGATTPASTSGDLSEDGVLTASGVITFRDVDLSNTHTAAASLLPVSGSISSPLPGFNPATSSLGSLAVTVNENPNDANNIGTVSWVYTLDNLVAQRLAKGQVVTQTFMVTITDSSGATVTQPVTVTITGTNDVPTIVLTPPNTGDPVTVDTGTVTEEVDINGDGDISATGIIVFKDVDLADTHTAGPPVLKSSFVNADLPGFDEGVVGVATHVDSVGTFTLDTALIGNNTDLIDIGVVGWTFTVDNSHPIVQSLAAGQTITQVYTITIIDSSGAPVSKDVTVTITGANDAPTVDALIETLDEPTDTTALSATFAVNFGDADLIDTGHSATILGVSPLGSTGGLTYTDLLALVSLGVVTKASGSQTGTFDFHFDAAAGTFDYLAAGETLKLTYDFQIADGFGGKINQTASITITGTNDAPTIAAVADTELAEPSDGAPTIDANIEVTFDDVDVTDTGHTATITAVAATGDITGLLLDDEQLIDLLTLQSLSSPAGSGVGTANFAFSAPSAAFDYLALNETLTLTYTVSVSDGDVTVTRDFVVTIAGSNDAPVITGGDALTTSISENTTEVTTVIATDVDHGATITYSIVPPGVGSPDAALFTIDPDTGVLSFITAPDYETSAGPYVVQVRASDGTTEDIQTITVNVTDVPEGPVVNDVITLDEGDVNTNLSPLLAANDEPGYAITSASAISGGALSLVGGVLTFQQGGDYSGQATLQYTASNGSSPSTASVIINYRPVADDPTFDTAATASGDEGAPIDLGPITAATTDTDLSETLVLKVRGYPPGTTFSKGQAGTGADTGKWIISDPAEIAALSGQAPDQTLTMTLPLGYEGGGSAIELHIDAVVTDAAILSTGLMTDTTTVTRDINVTVNPVNDAPVVTSASFDVEEGGTTVLSAGDIVVSDPDSTSHTFTVSNVEHGTFQRWVEGDAWEDVTSFTSAQLNLDMIRFVHDGSEFAPGFSIQADDGELLNHLSDEFAGSINFTNASNVAPTISVDRALESDAGSGLGRQLAHTVQLPNLGIVGATAVTVEFWLKDGLTTAQTSMLFGFQQYDLLVTDYGGARGHVLGFNTGNGDVYGIKLPDNFASEWHHVAAVFKPGLYGSKLYIDGVEQQLQLGLGNFGEMPGAAVFTDTPRIGGWTVDQNYSFQGQIDDFRIWRGERSAADIADNKDGLRGPATNDLLANYTFEQVSDGAGGVIDSSPNGNHGTLSVFTVNDNIVEISPTLIEDGSFVFSTARQNAITVGDVDGDDLVLEITVSYGTLTYNNSDGVVSLSGDLPIRVEGSAAVINAFLDGLTYQANEDFAGLDTLFITISDDGLNTVVEKQITLDVRPVNDAPALDLNGDHESLDFDTSVENGGFLSATKIVSLPGITDVDANATIVGATITVENAEGGDHIFLLGEPMFGINWEVDDSVPGVLTLTISGASSLTNYQGFLNQVRFSTESEVTGIRNISVTVNDGQADSNVAFARIDVIEADTPAAQANDDFLNILGESNIGAVLTSYSYNDGAPGSFEVISGGDINDDVAEPIDGVITLAGSFGTLLLVTETQSVVSLGTFSIGSVDFPIEAGAYIYVLGIDADGNSMPSTPIDFLRPGDADLEDIFHYTIENDLGVESTAQITVTYDLNPLDMRVRTNSGYDTQSLWADLHDGFITEIDGNHIKLEVRANGEETGAVTKVIVVDTTDLTFEPDGDNTILTGGTITGVHVYGSSGTAPLLDFTNLNMHATIDQGRNGFYQAVGPGGSHGAFEELFNHRSFDVHGSEAADVLYGGDFNDRIDTGGGADIVHAKGGNDLILVHDDNGWNIDGGDGVDTVRAVGSFETGQGIDMGSELSNIEILDLNSDGHAGAVSLMVDGEGVHNINATHTGRILGDSYDTVNFESFFDGYPAGMWVAGGQHVQFNPDNATPDVYFDQYFYRDGANTLATVYVHEDINVNYVPILNFDNVIASASAFTIQGGQAKLQIDNSFILKNDIDFGGELNVHDYPDVPQQTQFQFHGDATIQTIGFTDYTLSTNLMPGGSMNEGQFAQDGFFYRAKDSATDIVAGPQAVNMFISGVTNGGAYVLPGSPLDDIMIGGNTADQFFFAGSTGNDVIVNFQQGTDKINFQAYGPDLNQDNINGFLLEYAHMSGDDTVIAFQNNSIVVKGVALTANDFILHPGGQVI